MQHSAGAEKRNPSIRMCINLGAKSRLSHEWNWRMNIANGQLSINLCKLHVYHVCMYIYLPFTPIYIYIYIYAYIYTPNLRVYIYIFLIISSQFIVVFTFSTAYNCFGLLHTAYILHGTIYSIFAY